VFEAKLYEYINSSEKMYQVDLTNYNDIKRVLVEGR